jgi:hypothetical protein
MICLKFCNFRYILIYTQQQELTQLVGSHGSEMISITHPPANHRS